MIETLSSEITSYIFLFCIISAVNLLFFVMVSISIISMNSHLKDLVDLEYRKYRENKEEKQISNQIKTRV